VRVAVDEVGVEARRGRAGPDRRAAAPSSAARRGGSPTARPTMSPTVMRGFSEVYGSWKMIWICRRSRRSSFCPSRRRRGPVEDLPAVGFSSASSTLVTVDLPQPDSPTRPTVSRG
jgi:hypothetical protein